MASGAGSTAGQQHLTARAAKGNDCPATDSLWQLTSRQIVRSFRKEYTRDVSCM